MAVYDPPPPCITVDGYVLFDHVYAIPFHSIPFRVTHLSQKKSLMVARPYPSKQTCKGAQSVIYIMEPMDHIII